MIRKVFYSFHFDNDCWRTQMVRNMGSIEGNKPCHANEWEAVKRKGDDAIKRWIDGEMNGKSCVVVLIGRDTHTRPWVKYEINRGWSLGKGMLGVRIHGLKDSKQNTSQPGKNPFENFNIAGVPFQNIAPLFEPTGWDSQSIYASIAKDLGAWIDYAIKRRVEAG